jgi:hypothetical protein
MTARDVREGVGSQANRVTTMVKRATFEPAMLRVAITVATLVGYGIAYGPLAYTGVGAPAIVAFAVLNALFPRGPVTTLNIIGMIAGYMFGTAALGTPITWWRLATLAAVIYVVHACAAFAAVLPYDSVVSPGLFRPWLIRMAVVLAASVVVSVAVLLLPSLLGSHQYWVASIAGFVALLVIASYLFVLSRD